MFSYRHAFHAGNHADVLKHTVLLQLIRYIEQKETACMFIDTHAGAGIYALEDKFASKSAEYVNGIARLWERKDLPAVVADYVLMVKGFNYDGRLRFYPGSPYCAEKLCANRTDCAFLSCIQATAKFWRIIFGSWRRTLPRKGSGRRAASA